MSDSIGVFDVAMTGDDERRIAKIALDDKLAAATYDVREKHGEWLFNASNLQAFHDRVAMCYGSIGRTVSEHVTARTGTIKRVVKNLEQEWRQRQADLGGGAGAPLPATPGTPMPATPGVETPAAPALGVGGGGSAPLPEPSPAVTAGRRQACYPGCESNEAHAKKFHKDKAEKDARRRQAGEEKGAPAEYNEHDDPYGDEYRRPSEATERYHNPPPRHQFDDPEHFPFDPASAGPPGPTSDPWKSGRRQAAEDGAFERSQPDHPEQHIQETFQDHQGEELIPDGDFHGYQDSVDQGGPGKVESHDFIPGEHTDRHDESDSDNFVPTVTGSREYQHLARMLVADDLTGMDPNAAPAPGAMPAAGGGAAPPMPAAAGPTTTTPPAGSPSAAALPGGPPPVMASREFQGMVRMLAADKAHNWAVKAIQQGGTLSARQRLLSAAHQAGALSQVEYDAFAPIFANRRKLADRNYLQQADEAITKVLNEKAEEFQNTIAPLQQALITIQQAEQLQNPLNVQSPAGTVNVLPQGAQGNPAPAGDPSGGQAPQGEGGLGADPAAAALAGGADPSQQATPPQQLAASRRQAGLRVWHHNHGGNKPTGTTMKSWADDQGTHHHVLWDDGTDSAHHSEELHTYGQHADQPPSATTASRGRLPFDVRRQTAGIETEFDTFQKKKPGLSSGPAVDVENFVQQKQQGGPAKGNTAKPGAPATGKPRFGPKAINKLKTKQGLPAAMQIGPTSLADTASGITARRRTANDLLVEPGYAWSKAPASVKTEFAARVGSGVNPEQVFRSMIGEITKHHEGGLIGSHDAHRAANEAFGRLLLSRRGRRPLASGGR